VASSQPELTVTTSAEGATTVLEVSGEVDIGTAPVLRETFLRLLDQDEVPAVVLDMSGVAFCDSSGLAVLLMGARRWQAEGKRFALRSPSQTLARLIDLTGVRRAFEFEEGGSRES
jgi:anti-sigma B factor antagonist